MPIGLLPSPDKQGTSPAEDFRRQRSGKEGHAGGQTVVKRGMEADNGETAQDLIAAFIASDTVLPGSPSRQQQAEAPPAAAADDPSSPIPAPAAAAPPKEALSPDCATAEVQAVCTDASLAVPAPSPAAPDSGAAPTSAAAAAASLGASEPSEPAACPNLEFLRSPAILEVHPEDTPGPAAAAAQHPEGTPGVAPPQLPPPLPAAPAPTPDAPAAAPQVQEGAGAAPPGRALGHTSSFKKSLSKRWSCSMRSLRRASTSLRRRLHRDSPPVHPACISPAGSPKAPASPHLPPIAEAGPGPAAASLGAAAAAATRAQVPAAAGTEAAPAAALAGAGAGAGVAGAASVSMEEIQLHAEEPAARPKPRAGLLRGLSCACFAARVQ